MKINRNSSSFLFSPLFISVLILALGCAGNKEFKDGAYDDTSEALLLDDKFSETDLSLLAETMINSLANHPIFADVKLPPVVQIERVKNKTSEHIDTKAITDSIRTALIRTGKVRFSSKEDRETVAEEIDYQQDSGRVRQDTQRKRGRAIGSEYIVSGEIISNVQQRDERKAIWYRLTLNLVNIESGMIEWSDAKEIRKKYTKQ